MTDEKVGTSLPHASTTTRVTKPSHLDSNGRPSLDQPERRDFAKSDKKHDADSISHSSHSSVGSTHSMHSDDIDVEPAPRLTLFQTKSRTSSIRSRAVTIIQRSKRRGVLGRYGMIPEVARPIEYKRKTKWTITMIVALAAAAAPQGSAIFFRAYFLPPSCHLKHC